MYYLFTYEDSRDLFSIPYDIDIMEQVFRVKAKGEGEEELEKRELYNRKNKFFEARSLADVIAEIDNNVERERLLREMGRVKGLYAKLSETYQVGKREGAATSSVWK